MFETSTVKLYNTSMSDFYCEQIFSGKVRVKKVIETESVLAYYHTKPQWPIHIVVVPKKHIESLLQLETDDSVLPELLKIIKEVAFQITSKFGSCRILTNLGEYQDSKHLHFHVSSGKERK